MRVVFDTNVVVSGLLWSGASRRALRFAADKQIAAIASEALVDELLFGRLTEGGRVLVGLQNGALQFHFEESKLI